MAAMTRFVPPADARPNDTAWPAMKWPPPADVVLRGESVQVRPADPARDAAPLFRALDDDRVWTHLRGRPIDPAGWATTLAERAAAGWHTWVVESAGAPTAGELIGTSSYLEVAPEDARLEIGATAYLPSMWATRVNPETKLLLLEYAFDVLGAGRVQLKTDVRNQRSAQAIARLGATFEGTLRRYQRRADDTVRDTVLFSILAEEWPRVRDGLRARLASMAPTSGGAGDR
jgi:RimJ/RimL family protein N-acetyltransferase